MSEVVGAILFDTKSIQRYLFSWTRLKTNIGASYIVSHVFEDVLVGDVLDKMYGEKLDGEGWQNPGEMDSLPEGIDCYVAYIGGGNALVLFRDAAEAPLREVVRQFTKKLLVTYPGLKTGAALGKIDLGNFQAGLTELYKQLKKRQNTEFPLGNVPYTGLTLSCEINGEAANGYRRDTEGKRRFASQEVIAKEEKDEEADRDIIKTFSQYDVDLENFTLPSQLDDLGQKEGENDIAIIHIDGNNMGKRFRSMTTLQDRSDMSRRIQQKTEWSFAQLLLKLVEESYNGTFDDFLQMESDEKGRQFLPVRPLILGGDDVTFICPGRLSLFLARYFMKKMASSEGGVPISCCGGIAILPAAYPFFRGYELAEQLCGAAKAKSRGDDTSCWLDFAILHGEQAPTLEQIRQREYAGKLGNMHFGPWRVDDGGNTSAAYLDVLLQGIRAFGAKDMPRNKVKDLRFALQGGSHGIRLFLEQFRHTGHEIPKIKGWEMYEASGDLWYGKDGGDRKTPYIDVIEMMDYVPTKPAMDLLFGLEDEEERSWKE